MRFNTLASAVLLGVSGAALAQVATADDPKLGNGSGANTSANAAAANASKPADNVADPGKR